MAKFVIFLKFVKFHEFTFIFPKTVFLIYSMVLSVFSFGVALHFVDWFA